VILTIDIGNSNIVLAVFEGDNIVKRWRIITDRNKSKDEYNIVLKQLMKTDSVNVGDIKGVILSSVVPEVTFAIKGAVEFLNAKTLVVGDDNVKLDLVIKNQTGRKIGSDILMNIVAGKKRFKENFIIVDMGTATTFDVALQNSEYVGSIIAPGISVFSHGLHDLCSQLPLIEIKKPSLFIGGGTIDAMQSGVYYGYLGMVREILKRIREEFQPVSLKTYITGGISNVFVHDLISVDGIYTDLTSEGLNETWRMNNAK